MSDGGKGSARRPCMVDQKTLDDNWALIFGKKNIKDEECQPEYCDCDGFCTGLCRTRGQLEFESEVFFEQNSKL